MNVVIKFYNKYDHNYWISTFYLLEACCRAGRFWISNLPSDFLLTCLFLLGGFVLITRILELPSTSSFLLDGGEADAAFPLGGQVSLGWLDTLKSSLFFVKVVLRCSFCWCNSCSSLVLSMYNSRWRLNSTNWRSNFDWRVFMVISWSRINLLSLSFSVFSFWICSLICCSWWSSSIFSSSAVNFSFC